MMRHNDFSRIFVHACTKKTGIFYAMYSFRRLLTQLEVDQFGVFFQCAYFGVIQLCKHLGQCVNHS